jgi:hypothetical protein
LINNGLRRYSSRFLHTLSSCLQAAEQWVLEQQQPEELDENP